MKIILNGSVFVGDEDMYFEDFEIEIEEELDEFDDFDCDFDCENCDIYEDEDDEDDEDDDDYNIIMGLTEFMEDLFDKREIEQMIDDYVDILENADGKRSYIREVLELFLSELKYRS